MFIRRVLRGKHIYNIYSRKRDFIHITVNSINVHSISHIILSISETVGWDVGNQCAVLYTLI